MEIKSNPSIVKELFDKVTFPFLRTDIIASSGETVHSYCHVQYDPEKDEMYYKSVENDYHNEVSGSMKYDHSKSPSDNIDDLEKSFLDKVYNELK